LEHSRDDFEVMIEKYWTGIFALYKSLIQQFKYEKNITKVNTGLNVTDCIRNGWQSPGCAVAGLQ
jgi:hypothetical protein